MKVYLGFKFYEDMRNRDLIDRFDIVFKKLNMETSIIARDFKFSGQKYDTPELMRETFKEIDASDIAVIELSEKGVGLGIEAGYAAAKGKPIWVIAKTGSDISSTIGGIAEKVVFYNEPEDLLITLLKSVE